MAALRTRKLLRQTVPLRLSDGSEHALLRVRDPRARRIRLIVSEAGVRLTLPRWATDRDGDAFLTQHRDWLRERLAELASRRAGLRPLRFGDAGPVPLRGVAMPLSWQEGLFARADLHGNRAIVVTAPAGATPAQYGPALGALFEQEARRDLGALLPKYLPTLPRGPMSLKIRPLASLWGSLSARDGLSLDLSLILGPPAAFEYVLVHELCHLLVGDHSRRFWREVERRFPDWKSQRDYLRSEGMALKTELKRLTAAS